MQTHVEVPVSKQRRQLPPAVRATFDALYLDIVPGERVVYVYEVTVKGGKMSRAIDATPTPSAG